MLTRRGLLRGLAQIAVLGPLALRGALKVIEEPTSTGVTIHYDKYGTIYGVEFHRPLAAGDYHVDRDCGKVIWTPPEVEPFRWDHNRVGHVVQDEEGKWVDSGPARTAPTPGATS